MSKKLRFWLQVCVSLILLGVMISYLDLEEAKRILSQVHPEFLLLMFLVYAGDRVLMALKWNMLLHVHDKRFSALDAVKVYYVSSFVGYLLPLGGVGPDLVRIYKIREKGVSATIGTASIVVERILGLIATLLIAILGGLLLLKFLVSGPIGTLIQWLLLATVTGSAAALIFVFNDGLRSKVFAITRVHHVLNSPKFQAFYSALGRYREHKATLLSFLVLSILENLFPIMVIFVSGMALDISLPFIFCLAVVPISTVLERLPFSFAGIGLREGAYVVLFGLLGISYEEALMVGVVTFFAYLVSLAPGLLWMLLEGLPEKQDS